MTRFLFALVASLLLGACSEKPVDPPQAVAPPPPPATDILGVPTADPSASVLTASPGAAVTLAEAMTSPHFADLNRLVEFFYEREKRVPTMAELARSFGRPLPPPPLGYAFVIDAQAKKVKFVPVK